MEDNQQVIEQLVEYGKFLKLVNDSIDSSLLMLLSSKTQMDTVETIKLFSTLYIYGFDNAEKGIRKMLTLLFSQDQNVSQAVFDSYRNLYFNMSISSGQKSINLLRMINGASLTDLTCFEELIKRCIKNNTFEPEVIHILLQIYEQPAKFIKDLPPQINGADDSQTQIQREQLLARERQNQQRAALKIIRMVASSNAEILVGQKDALFKNSIKFAKMEKPDFILIQESLLSYEKLIKFQMSKKPREASDRINHAQINEQDNKYLQIILKVIINKFGTEDSEWYCASEALLNTIFNLKTKNSPEYAKTLIQELGKRLYQPKIERQEADNFGQEEDLINGSQQESSHSNLTSQLRRDINDFHYSQLFFVAGHVAIKMLTYIEQIDNELKKSGAESFNSNKNNKATEKGANNQGEENKKEDDELDQIAGGKEAEIEQYSMTLKKIVEESLIQEGILGKFLEPIVSVAKLTLEQQNLLMQQYNNNPEEIERINSSVRLARSTLLQRSAIMALCKYMCVSEFICQMHIGILFGLLNTRIDYGVKANIVISLGDMCNRFPNTLHEYQPKIFSLLHDPCNHVRRQALMVITHLVLNDMLKFKGEIVDICMLLEDEDLKIQDQVKLFLHELHTKGGNNIYNLFPKAISRLSKEFQHLRLEEFQNIARHLLAHIDKDKQTESIVERLCHKFRSSENPIEWRNTAYCLSQLKYTEKIFIKLLEFYETSYKERLLQSTEVKEYFQQLSGTLRKQFSNKPDLKKFLEEFDQKVGAADEQAQAQIKQNQLVQGVGSISKGNQNGPGRRQAKKVPSQVTIAADAQVIVEGDDVEVLEQSSNQLEEVKETGRLIQQQQQQQRSEFQMPIDRKKKRKFNEISNSSVSERQSVASNISNAGRLNIVQAKIAGGGSGRGQQSSVAKDKGPQKGKVAVKGKGGRRNVGDSDDDDDEEMSEDDFEEDDIEEMEDD